jgi:hypothetical protein
MIGPKKLSTIRDELKRALSALGDDPIRWLEDRIAEAEREGPGASEVLRSLQRLLDGPPKKTRRKKRSTASR